MRERIQAQRSAQTGLHCHFLPHFTIYVVGKKKVEVKETAQRLQDVLLHLSSNAGEWLTQNIWWSETIMFFFLSHISSWKYKAFKLWSMVKGDILNLYEFKERIRKLSLSLKAYHSPEKITWQKHACPPLKAALQESKWYHPDHWKKSWPEHVLCHGLYTKYIILIFFIFYF